MPKIALSKPFLAGIKAAIVWFGADTNVRTHSSKPILGYTMLLRTFPRI